MAETNNLTSTVEALFKGVNGLVSTKTVVGDAITVDNVTLIPLIDVSFGMGAGEFDGDKKEKGGGGLGGKITPSSVLVIKDGNARVVNIKNQDTITKLLDMVPELLDKFTTPKEEKVTESDVSDMLDSAAKKDTL